MTVPDSDDPDADPDPDASCDGLAELAGWVVRAREKKRRRRRRDGRTEGEATSRMTRTAVGIIGTTKGRKIGQRMDRKMELGVGLMELLLMLKLLRRGQRSSLNIKASNPLPSQHHIAPILHERAAE